MRRAEVVWLRTVLACRPPVTDFCLEACPVPGPPEAGASALRLRAPTSTGPGAGEELSAIGEALDIVKKVTFTGVSPKLEMRILKDVTDKLRIYA